jgi:hypothetical protein
MLESLTRKNTSLIAVRVAGLKSERWPASSRNGGRLQIGSPAGFTSEHPAELNRNLQTAIPCVSAASARRCSAPVALVASPPPHSRLVAPWERSSQW